MTHVDNWPRPGDRFFKADEDWYYNMCPQSIGYGSDPWELKARSYESAARVLVISMLNDDEMRNEMDLAFSPAMFMIRHCVELRLKQIAWHGNMVVNKVRQLPIKSHDVFKLWAQAKPLLAGHTGGPTEADLQAVEDLVYEVAEIDPRGEFFRYSSNMNAEFRVDLQRVGLMNIQIVMERLFKFLDMAAGHLSTLSENYEK